MDKSKEIQSNQKENESSQDIPSPPIPEAAVQKTKANDKTHQNEKNNYVLKQLRNLWGAGGRRYHRIREIFSKEPSAAWTAVFTGILTVFTILLWRVADRSDETNRISQRAFISKHSFNTVPVKQVTSEGRVTAQTFGISFENSGNTPARNGRLHIESVALPFTMPDDYVLKDSNNVAARFIVGPRGTFNDVVDVSMGDLQLLSQNKRFIYVWGWLTYKDSFYPWSKPHLYEFCTVIYRAWADKPDWFDPATKIMGTAADCTQHNCEDEDCSDYSKHF